MRWIAYFQFYPFNSKGQQNGVMDILFYSNVYIPRLVIIRKEKYNNWIKYN